MTDKKEPSPTSDNKKVIGFREMVYRLVLMQFEEKAH
jgi:hypothetical protein